MSAKVIMRNVKTPGHTNSLSSITIDPWGLAQI